MANPVLSRADGFADARPTQYSYPPQMGQQPYSQAPVTDSLHHQDSPTPTSAPAVMTLEDVIVKTAITMLALVATAALTWMAFSSGLLSMQLLSPVSLISALVGFGTVMLVAFRRKVQPGFVLFYAAIEGVFIGAISLIFELQYPGIVMQAVMGTFVAAGMTLAAYRFFNIRVTPKFRKIVFISTAAFAGVMLLNLMLSLFGVELGARSGVIGLLAAAVGATLAVFNLVVDFDYVERGIAARLDASESWRAAFGLTVTLVWLYVEILRLLSYLRR